MNQPLKRSKMKVKMNKARKTFENPAYLIRMNLDLIIFLNLIEILAKLCF